MSGDFIFSLARLPDVSALAELEAGIFPIEDYGPDVLTREKFQYFLTKGNAVILMAKQDNVMCGYILLLFRRGIKTARIYSLAVSPSQRGKGLGDALFASAASHCRAKGCTKIMLETRADNEQMQKLCIRHGFKLLKKIAGYYHDGQAALKFTLELARKGAK